MTTLTRPRFERSAVAWLLLTAGVSCMAVAWSTADLENANTWRRGQLQLLDELAANPSHLAPGPVAALDGLYARRVCIVATDHGGALVFEDDGRPDAGGRDDAGGNVSRDDAASNAGADSAATGADGSDGRGGR